MENFPYWGKAEARNTDTWACRECETGGVTEFRAGTDGTSGTPSLAAQHVMATGHVVTVVYTTAFDVFPSALPEISPVAVLSACPRVHGCPPDGSGLTTCCRRPLFEIPREEIVTVNSAKVTCRGR